MNEIEFKNWLSKKNMNKKVQSDIVSRLRRIEKEIYHCDIDEEYRNDKCKYLISLFSNMGYNSEMEKYKNTNFPIGHYSMNTFKYALRQYIHFCDELP